MLSQPIMAYFHEYIFLKFDFFVSTTLSLVALYFKNDKKINYSATPIEFIVSRYLPALFSFSIPSLEITNFYNDNELNSDMKCGPAHFITARVMGNNGSNC